MTSNLLDDGPSVFFAQPFDPKREGWDSLEACCSTAGKAGYRGGAQLQLWDGRLLDLDLAAETKNYCDEVKERAAQAGCSITSVANHLHTNLMVVARAYEAQLSLFADPALHFAPKDALEAWADEQVRKTILATVNFGFDRFAAFSGGNLYPFAYKWPAQPDGLLHAAFKILANRWLPSFNFAEDHGVKICFELHPGMDLLTGGALRLFLDEYVDNHEACCVNLDLSHMRLMGQGNDQMAVHIEELADRILMWHVKDAIYDPTGQWGTTCFQPWIKCPGQFASAGDGDIDYPRFFRLARKLDIDVIPVLEWESPVKGITQGIGEEGAPYIEACIANQSVPTRIAARPHTDVFDSFASGKAGRKLIAAMFGVPQTDISLA